jgi:hypothetical protein
VAPTGKDLDEIEMDEIDLRFGPQTGQFKVYAVPQEGLVHDNFVINYMVGSQ